MRNKSPWILSLIVKWWKMWWSWRQFFINSIGCLNIQMVLIWLWALHLLCWERVERDKRSSLIGIHDWLITRASWFNGHVSTLLSQWRWKPSFFDRWKLHLRWSTQGMKISLSLFLFSSPHSFSGNHDTAQRKRTRQANNQTITRANGGWSFFCSLMIDGYSSSLLVQVFQSYEWLVMSISQSTNNLPLSLPSACGRYSLFFSSLWLCE